MKTLATLCMTVCLLLAAVPPAAAETPAMTTVQGRYLRSETGDYNHAIFEVQGQEFALFCDYQITDALDAMKPSAVLTITYSTSMEFLPEAGQEVEISAVESVYIPNEYAPDTGVLIRLEMNRE